jgi:hypothetical protein
LFIPEQEFAKAAIIATIAIPARPRKPVLLQCIGASNSDAAVAFELLLPHASQYLPEAPMAYFERIRDVISEPFSSDVIRQRTAAGWQMISIEWRRELPDSEAPPDRAFSEDIPYGLRISEDCKRLEVDEHENKVLLQMMDLLAQDFSYSAIVSDLNEKGFRTRDGRPWSRVAVFNMMPRLIEVGPRIFSSGEWEQRRIKLARRAAP